MNLRVFIYRLFIRATLALSLGSLCLPLLAGADTDIGNIAVIEADPTILQPGEFIDLNDQTLTFTPKSGGGYTVTIGGLNFDSRLGNNLNLGNNDSVFRGLGFTFQFFGVNRTSVFINSNGHLTFGNFSFFAHFNGGGGLYPTWEMLRLFLIESLRGFQESLPSGRTGIQLRVEVYSPTLFRTPSSSLGTQYRCSAHLRQPPSR